jgi:hypothetical protein
MSRFFSDRHGYGNPAPPISVREDAPQDLRFAIAAIAKTAGMGPKAIREIVCRVLFVAPDPNNWSDYPNIWDEVLALLLGCEWFKVYDIAEALWRHLDDYGDSQLIFQDELNRLFREKGIGWELKDSGIMFRGGETFAVVTTETVAVLRQRGRGTAANEIHEAIKDISRRPAPDRTGAVYHAIAALECTARDVSGEPKLTLGDLVPKLDLPKPLDQAVTKLWGFASERARHLREGGEVGNDEAELVVGIACALCEFLAKRKDR